MSAIFSIQNNLRVFKRRDSESLYKKVVLNKLLQLKRLALVVDEAFYFMFKYKKVLVLIFKSSGMRGPEEGGSKRLRNVGDYRSTHRGFLEDSTLHETSIRITNLA